MAAAGIFRPGMRGYFIPLVAGLVLAGSAFLPWVKVGDTTLTGVPDTAALWIIGFGLLAALLSVLSLVTRKNSRHPLLLVGLLSLGVMFLSWRLMPRVAADRALMRLQALAIVEETPFEAAPPASAGNGIYVGLVAASIIVVFGMTIVVRRVARPYVVESPDDDV
jgi:hypothetical protein